MRIYENVSEIRAYLNELHRAGKSIGLIPTMGALHDGHLTLIKQARSCDCVVVSIFVNPLQFNKIEDLENYPRQLAEDISFLDAHCDVLFAPKDEDMYLNAPRITVDFNAMGEKLEGAFRPGHFNGVGIVVAKLFNIIQPDYAYFGLKDLQQFLLIKQMVTDLSIPVKIEGCPIIREESGLALSSRNLRLSLDGKQIASSIYKGLSMANSHLKKNKSISETKSEIMGFYRSVSGLEIEYFELVNESLETLTDYPPNGEIVACFAGYVEGIRLIDNLYLRSEN